MRAHACSGVRPALTGYAAAIVAARPTPAPQCTVTPPPHGPDVERVDLPGIAHPALYPRSTAPGPRPP